MKKGHQVVPLFSLMHHFNYQLQPLVPPQVLHFMQVPLRTSV